MNTIYTSIGKRKTAVVKVYLSEGTGIISINKKEATKFFFNLIDKYNYILKPFILLNLLNKYNIIIFSKGGGINAQMEAMRLAISKTLCKINLNYTSILKQYLFLKRDSRIKEIRKYGLKKARKAPQYSKR